MALKPTPLQAHETSDTDASQGARTLNSDALSGGKGSTNSSTDQMDGAKTTGNSAINFRVREDEHRELVV